MLRACRTGMELEFEFRMAGSEDPGVRRWLCCARYGVPEKSWS